MSSSISVSSLKDHSIPRSTENCFNTDVTRGVIVNSKCNRNHLAARLPADPLGSLQCSPEPVAGARDGSLVGNGWEERDGNGMGREEGKGRSREG